MKQSRNDACECGSGKKYKNCCMIDSGDSFLKKYGLRVFIAAFAGFLAWTFYNKYMNIEPTVWCYECNRYVLESSTGHKTEPIDN